MIEFFLLLMALVWAGFASIQDIKKLEIDNWISFSLIIFALGFRFFFSLFSGNFNFFYQGLVWLGIFYVLGNIFYYSRLFAGGDAKLIIALGSVLGISSSFFTNLFYCAVFLMIFLFSGGIYGGIVSFVLVSKNFNNFQKEFKKTFNKYKNIFYMNLFFALFLIILGINENVFMFIGFLILIMPLLFFYARAVDESCSIKIIPSSRLREGDWLYEKVKVGKKTIQPKWEGLSSEEIKIIRKNKKRIKIRQGIPFVPVIFFSLLFYSLLMFLIFN